MTQSRRYWLNTVSLEHVRAGAAGGFTQADHGKNTRLKHLNKGDLLVFYSPRTALKNGEPVQAFTALGEVTDNEPYQVEMTPDFHPWRRRLSFMETEQADIRPLLEDLSFIGDKRRWGYPFRRGLFEIGEADFGLIAHAMKARLSC